MKKLNLLTVLLIVLSMILVTACGNSTTTAPSSQSKPEANNQEGGSQEAPKPSGDPVKIGAVLPYSGVYASLGENLTKGMELYFDSVNWEVAGSPIQLIKEDTEADPQVALRKYRKLVDQDNIDILTGPVSTAVAYALRDEVDNEGLPFLVSHAGGNDLTRDRKSDFIWRSSFNSWQIGHSMGQWAYDNIGKRIYVTAADYAFGHEVASAFMEAFKSAGGEIIGEVYPPLGTNDFSSYLTQMRRDNPDAVYAFFAGSDAVRFVQQYEEFGLKNEIPLIGSGWLNAEDVRPAQGNAPEGIKSTMFWDYHLDTPENKDFVAAYEEKYSERPSVESLEGYDAARIIVEALTALNGDASDRNKVVEAISQVEFVSPRGPIKFDPNTHHIIQNIYIIETVIEGGQTENKVIDNVGEAVDPGK